MPSLSPSLQNRLRDALLKCAPFGSNEVLRLLFDDDRLAAWKYNVPEAATPASRVSFLISQFMDAWNAEGQNALSLFLCVLSELPERGAQCSAADLCALAAEVQTALIAGKIAECERELTQVRDHQSRGWTDAAYAQRRLAELQTMIQTWKARQAAPPLCSPEPVASIASGSAPSQTVASAVAQPSERAPETYTDLEIHIAPKSVDTGRYAVTAELDSEGKYYGAMQMGVQERERFSAIPDSEAYGVALFDALFHDDIYIAFATARERAHAKTADRLRLRLWIDHEAVDLHALVWERLHYRSESGAFRVATDAKLPFSRYFGLQRGEASAIEGQVRMLCVIANPQNLEDEGFVPLDVDAEIANLRAALDGLRQSGVSITIMPGRTGLSDNQKDVLTAAGYTILSGFATLGGIFEALAYAPGYHLLHFVGHGTFSQRTGKAALILEDEEGFVREVADNTLTGRLNGLDHKPHLIFLAACESASRSAQTPNPFVGLAPRLVQIGIPAVVAMQDKIGVKTAQALTRHFYRFLLQHGVVDKALNQARNLLEDTQDWATPVLFMHLREGRLLK
ncbi:MAG TPA: CHAT domain-containing protein [Anaerolineae bacterium]|nr:CHAT domain-containing protein [Anaerolineae bacterium]HQI87704.1 CHAT domain-containing protein [Anaerolineae bacterium]